MDPEIEVIHLRHDIRSVKAQHSAIASKAKFNLDIALEALECDRPHVAVEKIKFALDHIAKLDYKGD